ncbi:MAG TPA: pitrilysin family protein [Bryobacteraceae bacterium]|jgi:predicted Zn-dependent peptidase|nr:pitrilysin family protein [Bryobacteraceae bacterium]
MKRLALFLAILTAGIVVAQEAPKPVSGPPSYKSLKYPPLPQVKIPEPVEATLSNGMRLLMLEDHELPLIRGLALVRTGNLLDPSDQRGLSQVMADVLRSGGTKSKTGDQIDEELENIAGTVEAGMDETSANVSFSGLKETTDRVLAVFKDVLTNPEFRQDKLDLTLTQYRSAIARRNDDASDIPGRELTRILYGKDTPYGWQPEYADLARIHREDLLAFYQRYYFPKNIMLAVYGDFNAAEMKDKLEKLFAEWKVEQPAAPPFPALTAKPAPGIYFAPKEDVTQTFFSIGELGGTLRDPDYPALEVATNILGEGFSSRLVSRIRTQLGYAYSIGASWAANYNFPGTFRISGSTKSMTTVETVQAIREEVEKLRTAEVTEKELDEAKQAVLNSFVFNFDSPAKTLNRVMRYEYFGYPKDFLFQYQKAIAAVTRADVLRVAKQHIRPDELAIVTVGNPKEFGKPLATLGKVTELDLTIPEPKQELSKADAGSLARGKQLLERAQQAMGGAEKLAGVKDATYTADIALEAAAGGIRLKLVNMYLAPDQLRQEQELPGAKIIEYSDGKSGFLSTPQGVQPMPAEALKQAQGELFREPYALLLSDRDPARIVNAVGENAVEVAAANGGLKVKIEFDPATGLPARETYTEAGVTGAPAETTEIYSDWREVGGVKLPHKAIQLENGMKMLEATVSEYKINSGLNAAELSKRP